MLWPFSLSRQPGKLGDLLLPQVLQKLSWTAPTSKNMDHDTQCYKFVSNWWSLQIYKMRREKLGEGMWAYFFITTSTESTGKRFASILVFTKNLIHARDFWPIIWEVGCDTFMRLLLPSHEIFNLATWKINVESFKKYYDHRITKTYVSINQRINWEK